MKLAILLHGHMRSYEKTHSSFQRVLQNLKKEFVAQKDPKKREKLKKELIALHKKVQKAEDVFNRALMGEPIDPMEI